MAPESKPSRELNLKAVRQAANDSNISVVIAERLRRPLSALLAAASKRKVEPICTAYRALREAAKGVDEESLFALADSLLKRSARELVVSAYSHRHCFMCDGGSVLCERCGGDPAGEACSVCGNLGLVECAFCGGTGWADRNTIPAELAPAVLSRQLKHVRGELQRAAASLAGLPASRLRGLSGEKRQAVAAGLIQARARLRDLLRSDAIEADQQVHLAAPARRIQAGLEALKRR